MGGSERDATGSDESTDRQHSSEMAERRSSAGAAKRRRSSGTAKRRSVLRALGGAGALAALGGAGGASAAGSGDRAGASVASATDARSPEAARDRARQDGDIDPVWGYPALSDDEEPPVEPDHEVELQIRPRDAPVPEFVFEPTGLSVEPGDAVRFSYESPHHTVTAYHPAFGYRQRVPDGVPPFSAPALPVGGYWLYTFEQEGVYDLHCAPHEIFGHAMRVVAGSPSGPGAEPLPDLCPASETTGEAGGTTDATAITEAATGMQVSEPTGTTGPAGATATTEAAGETGTTTVADGDEGEGDEGEGGGEGEGEGGEASEPEPPRLGAYVVLSDPALDPDAVVEEEQVSWDDLAPESKRVFVRFEGFPPC